jgi:hypothetical protein
MQWSNFARRSIGGDEIGGNESVVTIGIDLSGVKVEGVAELNVATYRYKPIETKVESVRGERSGIKLPARVATLESHGITENRVFEKEGEEAKGAWFKLPTIL